MGRRSSFPFDRPCYDPRPIVDSRHSRRSRHEDVSRSHEHQWLSHQDERLYLHDDDQLLYLQSPYMYEDDQFFAANVPSPTSLEYASPTASPIPPPPGYTPNPPVFVASASGEGPNSSLGERLRRSSSQNKHRTKIKHAFTSVSAHPPTSIHVLVQNSPLVESPPSGGLSGEAISNGRLIRAESLDSGESAADRRILLPGSETPVYPEDGSYVEASASFKSLGRRSSQETFQSPRRSLREAAVSTWNHGIQAVARRLRQSSTSRGHHPNQLFLVMKWFHAMMSFVMSTCVFLASFIAMLDVVKLRYDPSSSLLDLLIWAIAGFLVIQHVLNNRDTAAREELRKDVRCITWAGGLGFVEIILGLLCVLQELPSRVLYYAGTTTIFLGMFGCFISIGHNVVDDPLFAQIDARQFYSRTDDQIYPRTEDQTFADPETHRTGSDTLSRAQSSKSSGRRSSRRGSSSRGRGDTDTSETPQVLPDVDQIPAYDVDIRMHTETDVDPVILQTDGLGGVSTDALRGAEGGGGTQSLYTEANLQPTSSSLIETPERLSSLSPATSVP